MCRHIHACIVCAYLFICMRVRVCMFVSVYIYICVYSNGDKSHISHLASQDRRLLTKLPLVPQTLREQAELAMKRMETDASDKDILQATRLACMN